jgi:hypothetical protein
LRKIKKKAKEIEKKSCVTSRMWLGKINLSELASLPIVEDRHDEGFVQLLLVG